ncbi:MAG: hypothetical protein KF802_11025 [Bdellovibrionaceae bacterium]|nr:hypothetical protein [Pseudobdellovibrionaceae bacterium]MBX3032646.1 hypothetical protein [Pseudobdellovibrionaceae bacterium]
MLTLSAMPATAAKDNGKGRLLNPVKASGAPSCTARPDFLKETRTEISGGFAGLPKGQVLVARDAEMWVENTEGDRPVRLHSYQSFVRSRQSKILCGDVPEKFADRFSLIAPTLIDADSKQKIGHSLWQFQVIADREGLSAWNKKSPVMSKTGALDAFFLKDMKLAYRLYHIGDNEFELLVQKEADGMLQTLSVRYETVR